ncbi:MAG: hypothetical protein M0R06_03245 [Sphaerochaeta sp.]|nr:hypothetical protein [Sphaerochaeta sp.]
MKDANLAVQLDALLRRIDSKSLRSGDKGVSLTFEIDNPSDENMNLLNRLHDPQRQVHLGIWR